MDYYGNIANYIRVNKKRTGIDSDELKNKLGLKSWTVLHNIERGLSTISRSQIRLLAEAFGTSQQEVIDIIILDYRESLEKTSKLAIFCPRKF